MMRFDRGGSDRGAVAVFFALQAVMWVLLASLIVVGGGRVRAHQRAYNIAAEAARIAGQVLIVTDAMQGVPTKRIDVPGATQAVALYLAAAGAAGNVQFPTATTIVVNVVVSYENPTGIRLPGLDSTWAAEATATATLVYG